MNCCHQTFSNPELFVNNLILSDKIHLKSTSHYSFRCGFIFMLKGSINLGEWGKTVSSAASIGNNLHFWFVGFLVHTHDKHGSIRGRCRDNYFLCTSLYNISTIMYIKYVNNHSYSMTNHMSQRNKSIVFEFECQVYSLIDVSQSKH